MDSGSESKYPTMTLDEICNLDVKSISSKDSCLFLWGTVPLLPEAFEVMKSWGFKYKTMITWRKIMSLGMGYWLRGQCEHLLLGIRGSVEPFRLQEPNFIQCNVLKHSRKPEEVRNRIVKLFGDIPRIELFAREKTPGWDVWGNEVESDIEL